MGGHASQAGSASGGPSSLGHDSGAGAANTQLSLLDMIETIDNNKYSKDRNSSGKKGEGQETKNTYLRGDEVLRAYADIDEQLLMNTDK